MIRPILALLALASLSIGGARSADAATLTVDCLGGPFFNINAALAAAVPGDTILAHVCFGPGGAYPPFTVPGGKSAVRIVAADAFLPYVGALRLGVTATPGGFAPPVIVNGAGVAGPCAAVTNATDITIAGFTFTNCGTHGIYVLASNHVSLIGNRIDHTGQAGVRVENAGFEDVRIVGNLFYFTGRTGIALMSGTRLSATDNTLLHSGREGIYVDIPAVAELVNNNVTLSQKEGIVLRGTQGQIDRNTSNANLLGGGACQIFLDGMSVGNYVIGNLTTGVAPGSICGALAANLVVENL